jgi:cell wall-associated NlpC family hydrolase
VGAGAASASAATYTVHGGDTLHGIAAAHHESTAELLAANRSTITDPNVLYPGETLTLASESGGTSQGHGATSAGSSYTVRSGDTVHRIAQRYGVSTSALLAANHGVIDDPNVIYPGQHLTLPDTASKTASPPSTSKHSAEHAPKHGGGSSGIVAQARHYLGVPYSWGGTSGSGMDCSGLVYRVMRDLGHDAPRTAAGQQDWVTPISESQAEPGDLVFWGNPAHHEGIYIGDGQMIVESVPGTSAHVQNLYGSPTFGRVP